jgi:hypothetical protein
MVDFCDSYDHLLNNIVFKKFAQEFRDPKAFWYDRKIGNDYGGHEDDIYAVLWEPKHLAPAPPAADAPAAYFPDCGWCIMRSDWQDDDASVLALKIGSTRDPHGHADVGGFIVHTHGRTTVCELGIGRYGDPRATLFRESAGHNLPLLDGQMQKRDKPRHGVVEDVRLTSGYNYLRAELAPAYDLPNVPHFRRSYLFVRPDRFIVIDQYELLQDTEIDWRLHYQGESELAGSSALLRTGRAQVAVAVLQPHDARLSVEEHTGLAPMRFREDVLPTAPYLRFVHRAVKGRALAVAVFWCGDSEQLLYDRLQNICAQSTPDSLKIAFGDGLSANLEMSDGILVLGKDGSGT